jgi:hypothetical protein
MGYHGFRWSAEFPLALNDGFSESSRENVSEKGRGVESIRDWKLPFCFWFFLASEGCAQIKVKVLQVGEPHKYKSWLPDQFKRQRCNYVSSAPVAYCTC